MTKKDYYIANAVAKAFGDCEVRVNHERKYVHKDGVLVETNPNKRITVIYVNLPHWVTPRIGTSSIRIMLYEHPFMHEGCPYNTLCSVGGDVKKHWKHDDFMASTPQELCQNLKKWKAELEAY